MAAEGARAVGVGRVSGAGRPERGSGREAQRRALANACRRRGWRLERAERQTLVAAKNDRLAQLLLELAGLLASARRQGWALDALDCALEPPAAKQRASLRASFAPCHRQLIAQRTRQALARKRAQGARLGRPPTISPYALARIRRERAAGKSLAAIANGLNADHIPTAQGGRQWYPATIRYTLKRTT